MTGTVASLAGEFVSATLGLAEEDLPEGFLVGVQVFLEAVRRQLVTLTGLLPAEAAATLGASTCRNTQSQCGARCPLQSWILKQGKGFTERATEVKGRGQEVGTASALPTALPQSHLHILPRHKEQKPSRRQMSPGLHVGVAVVSFSPQAAHGLRQQAGLSSQPPGPTSYSRHSAVWNISSCRRAKLPCTYICATATGLPPLHPEG